MIADRALYFRRRVANAVFIILSMGAALFGLVWLAFILCALLKGACRRCRRRSSPSPRRRRAWRAGFPTPSSAAW